MRCMILLEFELVGESSSSYVRADFSISVFSVLAMNYMVREDQRGEKK